MIDLSNKNYNIKDDIESILEAEMMEVDNFSKETGISKNTLIEINKKNFTTNAVYEKFYSYSYKIGYRFNLIKEEFLKESNKNILFHGSKNGLKEVSYNGSREKCDFGCGFYLGQSYSTTISFVCENENSCIYSFKFSYDNLNVLKFGCSLEWMLAICYFRGFINKYTDNKKIIEIINKINESDVIIAPIADNRMFYIMSLFANGDITDLVAIHSLSASSLGNQVVIKSEKALNNLKFVEKYYVSKPEKQFYIGLLNQRSELIETKLKLAKREYRDGKYIEEVLE
ncbi:MAG: DUF3990 domain-containing protein [Acholeplasmatales bacterium]|nr:DUF3990 domain-containing protein [Acholeplasmatales bacterium]